MPKPICLAHVCFGPVVRIVHGITCRSTAELRSAVRYFTQSKWAAKRIRRLTTEKKGVGREALISKSV
jgi:hypothetical protein